jgi:hypothetical protein
MKFLQLLLVGFLLSIQTIYAQNKNTPVSVQLSNVKFETIIQSLETQTGFLFSYDANIASKESKYSLNEINQPFDFVLNKFLKPLNITYKINGQQIILSTSPVKKKYTISGTVIEKNTGETVIGATIRIKNFNVGTKTNSYGFYTISLDEGEYILEVTYIGFEKKEIQITLNNNVVNNISITPNANGIGLKEVVVKSSKTSVREFTKSTEMGRIEIPVEMMKKVPTIAGESDLMKVLQLTPGIKRGGEGTIGMYVRGGGADENLILLDEATVYNAGHLLGFFSVFNTSSIKDVTMHKGGFPSNYGGRLSSVLDIRMKDGNKNKFQTEGSVGLISSNLTIQGPIYKDKVSFILSGRRTYIDKVFSLVNVPIPYYFYDVNAKLNWTISKRDKLFFSSYFGNDVLKLDNLTESVKSSSSSDLETRIGSKIGNFTTTLRWNHIFKNPKLFLNTSILQTRFRYNVIGSFSNQSLKLESRIQDYGMKMDFNYNPNPKNQIRFGTEIINHTFNPNSISSNISILDSLPSLQSRKINSTEMALYALNDWEINSKFKLNYGLRISSTYIQKTLYAGLEPRINIRYQLNESNSIKMSYSRMKQYMHLVSSSAIALPTDLWYPVTKTIKPLSSDQVSLGYYTGLDKFNLFFSTELYYKKLHNLVEYKEGSVLLLNNNFENELVRGNGDAYGLELFLNKTQGRFSGWVGYTLSYSTRQFDSLNRGKKYFSKYDRRHDVSIVGMYDITKRLSVSAVWVYSSGSPFTARVGQYIIPNQGYNGITVVPLYSDRNAYRLSNSHRLDIDFTIKRKSNRKWAGEWHFSAYNVYNRTQPSRVRIILVDGQYKYQQVGLFGIIPSISYNFKF